jgi:hypothetical protein
MDTHGKIPSVSTSVIVLPLPPESLHETGDIALYARFMRHLRHVPSSRMEIKILSAIQFTADIEGCSDAHVAKTLVDLGLRGPRVAFPADFLKFADAALMRQGWEVGGPTQALLDLRQHWDNIGESVFVAFSGEYSLVGTAAYL